MNSVLQIMDSAKVVGRRCKCLEILILAALLVGCNNGDSTGPTTPTTGANGTYLFLTNEASVLGEKKGEMYYASVNVGTSVKEKVRIANRGADVYTLTDIGVVGESAEEFDVGVVTDEGDEFTTQIFSEVTLQPAEAVTLDIIFAPITEGPKTANFTLNYATREVASEEDNLNEQNYYQAVELANSGALPAARKKYTAYLENDPVTTNKQRAAIRLPIVDEARNYGTEKELSLYLKAMTERDYQQYQQALSLLDVFLSRYPDSYLADDALYLKGYIYLMDLNDPANALRAMQTLRKQYRDSTYKDTVLYSEALAQKALGNLMLAEEVLLELKHRHTGISTLGIQLPKDNLVSRLWFERATSLAETLAL